MLWVGLHILRILISACLYFAANSYIEWIRYLFLKKWPAMNNDDKDAVTSKQKIKAEKADRLAEALRENLRKRKSLQRGRGDAAPDAIKNKNRMTD